MMRQNALCGLAVDTISVGMRAGHAEAFAGHVSVGFLCGAAQAQQAKAPEKKTDLGDVCGFKAPTDTPGKGYREFAHEVVGRFGQADGSFGVFNTKTQIGDGVTDWFGVTPGQLAQALHQESAEVEAKIIKVAKH